MRPYKFADIKLKRPFFYEVNKVFRETYNLGIPLGSGSTSSVRRCENRERANSKCAKMITIDCYKELLNEISILKKLYHPLIIDAQEVVEEPKKLYLIEELCMGGDVANALSNRPTFSEEEAAHIIKGALMALAYCHDKGSRCALLYAP
jgi:serine/threonine protein kinase